MFPKDKVPAINFKKQPNDCESEYYTSCYDCRLYNARLENERRLEKMKSASDKDLFFCIQCKKEFEYNERAINLDGSESSCCLKCKEISFERKKKRKEEYNKLKYEKFQETQCSCVKCNKIFLKPKDEDSIVVEKLKTYQKEDDTLNRYIFYENIEYSVKQFLEIFENKLEYSVIQFDHMTEKELRDSGKLKDDEIFVGKTKEVPKLRSKYARKKEIKICQNLCIECHIIETKKREKGHKNKEGIARRIKKEYVNKLKSEGCSCCGYKNINLLRFFDMDHLDPFKKITCISEMVIGKYSLEETIEECSGCRVLCKMCHAVHTRKQHEKGLLIKKNKN